MRACLQKLLHVMFYVMARRARRFAVESLSLRQETHAMPSATPEPHLYRCYPGMAPEGTFRFILRDIVT